MNAVVTRSGPVNIMISSTVNDLVQYRSEASRIVKDVAQRKQIVLTEESMENNTSDGKAMRAISKSKEWVEEADWIVVIVGFYYGYISDEPGADGLSVTEWEYRHANQCREAGERKNIYVFVAGDDDHHGPKGKYRAAQRENEPLGDWYRKENHESHNKLGCFKAGLRKNNQVKFFRDIEDFCKQLRETLENAVEDLPPDVKRGGTLARLFAKVSPAFRDCIEQVELLADAKGVHDALHDMLHEVVRRMKDELLPAWRRDNRLGAATEKSMMVRWSDARDCLGRLRELQTRFEKGHQRGSLRNTALLESVKHLREDFPPLWNPEAAEPPDVEEFEERLDEFTDAALFAFRTADDEMARNEDALTSLYEKLMLGINRANAEQRLNTDEQRQLDDGLEKMRANKDQLNTTLETHHRWQDIHDQFQKVESFRGSRLFIRKMRAFSRNELNALKTLLDNELGDPDANTTMTAGDGAGDADLAPASNAANEPPSDAEALQELITDFEAAGGAEREEVEPAIEAFDHIVSLFERIFYQIDKRTLFEVERARERVTTLRVVIESLADEKSSAA